MASVAGLQRIVKEWKPHVQSAFIVYVTPRPSPVAEPDPNFEMIEINDGSHPVLPQICASKRQLKVARKAINEGRWNVVVALDGDKPVGRIWQALRDERGLFTGIPRVRLAKDEILMFDLFVEREYRRSGVAFTMADYFFKLYKPDTTSVSYVYGFVSYENAASIMWHHANGFLICQTLNYLSIGPYIKWRIPFSDMPRFGPWSRRGRHSDPDKDLFGTALFPG